MFFLKCFNVALLLQHDSSQLLCGYQFWNAPISPQKREEREEKREKGKEKEKKNIVNLIMSMFQIEIKND